MIGIVSPYDFSESTAMATTLAGLIKANAVPVSILSHTPCELEADAAWANHVVSAKKLHNQKDWYAQCSHVVWTSIQPDNVLLAKRAGAKNILLVNWRNLVSTDREHFAKYDSVVCPSRTVFEFIAKKWPSPNLCWCVWDPLIPLQSKLLPRTRPTRLGVLLDGYSTNKLGPRVFYALQVLLERAPNVEISVVYLKQWRHRTLAALTDLQRVARGRLKTVYKPCRDDRLRLMADSDWLWWATVCENSCHFGLESLALGTPLLAFDMPPLLDVLADGENAKLLPCYLQPNWLGVPEADPLLSPMIEKLSELFTTPNQLISGPWGQLIGRFTACRNFWLSTLNLDTEAHELKNDR